MSESIDLRQLEQDLGGRYQIVRELGRGAFGTVFLAREIALHRLVAIKALHRERVVSAEERERFTREARTIGQLSHPGIVPLLTASIWCCKKGRVRSRTSRSPSASPRRLRYSFAREPSRHSHCVQHDRSSQRSTRTLRYNIRVR